MSHFTIHLRHPTSVFLRTLPKVILYLGYLCMNLIGSLGCEHPGGLWVLRLCLTSVTTFGAMSGWNKFSQSCPSLNLWSSVSTFPERLLFPTCKPLHILFPLHGIQSTERKSNPSFKATAKDSLITLAQIALSYHSLCLYHTGPLAYLHLHFYLLN